ncbi:diaminobutyrate--2-oxoglutarate transaminase family protein [Streptomyces sp. NPDC048636]|uniref:diaminobutyrate--2-oxoglutarate transaminase family protein n=1 Tax=Streptomyces sp. NPDC048636 TaxID=3155762 RepID=UPI00343F0AEC
MAVIQLPPMPLPGAAVGGGSGARSMLRRQASRESAARTYARALPIVPVRARGLTIEGADGRRYLDCLSGAGTLALGHNHPVVLKAIRGVLDSGAPLQALDLATPVKDSFTEELFTTLPPELARHARVQFCGPAGTDAVEAALTLVRSATGRDGLLAFSGAPHGTTAEALAVSGGAPSVGTTRLPFPHDYRCPFGVGGARGAELSARWTETLLDHPESGVGTPAGMILEPVQGEGGVIPAPDGWLRRMRDITAARSIPLIVDEVQTGVGRTGAFWAVQHSGVVPDVMVLSKAIGGSMPLAVIVYHERLDAWRPGAHAGTFRGNQPAMAAGAATLAYVRENHLAERAAALGDRMLHRLRQLAERHAHIGEVRGRGLMIGLELVDPEAAWADVQRTRAQRPEPERPRVGFAEVGQPGDGRPGAGRTEAGRTGAGRTGAGRTGAGRTGAGRTGAGRTGAGRTGAGPTGAFGVAAQPRGAECPHPTHSGADLPDTAYRGTGGPGPRPPAPMLAAAVQQECLHRGLIVELSGSHASVIRLLPPLTITDEQAEAVLDRLADALDAAIRTTRAPGPGPERPPTAPPFMQRFTPPFAGDHR